MKDFENFWRSERLKNRGGGGGVNLNWGKWLGGGSLYCEGPLFIRSWGFLKNHRRGYQNKKSSIYTIYFSSWGEKKRYKVVDGYIGGLYREGRVQTLCTLWSWLKVSILKGFMTLKFKNIYSACSDIRNFSIKPLFVQSCGLLGMDSFDLTLNVTAVLHNKYKTLFGCLWLGRLEPLLLLWIWFKVSSPTYI